MGIQGYAIFVRLLKEGHRPEQMGLKASAGDISRWSSRVKLARNFRGLQVDDYSERTLLGYSGFFRVFLAHSALERYQRIVGLDGPNLRNAVLPYNPRDAVQQFFAHDRSGRLFDFLHLRLESKKLQNEFAACRNGTSCDVICLSDAVRHIFAHGHLAANSHDISPTQVARACEAVSGFLLDFMENDFGRRIAEYYQVVVSDRPACGAVAHEPSS